MTPERWAQIETLFHRAAECDSKARAALLDESCRKDADLRREVEALLFADQTAANSLGAAVQSQFRAFAFPLSGQTISHYRVLDGLGGGGMGLVYCAEDLKLGRKVALKFLPDESAKDSAALGRFEREARSASALEHPNICPIYEFGEHEGQPFLVMQLLDGKTLHEIISAAEKEKPPFELRTLLDLAIQITDGLDAAHRHGIVHRDIKPANIFITRQEQAKILDFGLAKLAHTATDGESDRVSAAADQTSAHLRLATPADLFLSRTGAAIGTAGYMSPEQIRGEKLDARTDLFSFGLVLYEMVAGKRAFPGATGPQLQQAILKEKPTPIRSANPASPAELERITLKLLEKQRESRYQTAAELRRDLEGLRQRLESRNSARMWAGGAAIVLLLMGLVLWLLRLKPPVPTSASLKLTQLTFNAPENHLLSAVISPNGKSVAYSDLQGIHLKSMDTKETKDVALPAGFTARTADWEVVAWFPGSSRLLANAHPPNIGPDWTVSTGSSIWTFTLLEGVPTKLRDNAIGWSVSPDGKLVSFITNSGSHTDREVWLAGPHGENAYKLLEAKNQGPITGLYWSPDGQRFLYGQPDGPDEHWYTRRLNGGPTDSVFPASNSSRTLVNDLVWLRDGRLVYSAMEPEDSSSCNLWESRMDTQSGELRGHPSRLTTWGKTCAAYPAASDDGNRLTYVSLEERVTSYVADVDTYGTHLSNPRQLTLTEGVDMPWAWTPDSKAVFISSAGDGQRIYRQSLTDDPPALVVAEQEYDTGRICVSPDGEWLVYERRLRKPSEPYMMGQLVRIPINGGEAQKILDLKMLPDPFLNCTRAPVNLCVIVERTEDRKFLIVSTFDVLLGRGPELIKIPIDAAERDWTAAASPDGTHLAVILGTRGPVRILSLDGKPLTQFSLSGWTHIEILSWTADSKAVLVSGAAPGKAALLRVDLDGRTQILCENRGANSTYAVPSPDGRHIAFTKNFTARNAWMIEGF